MGTHGVVDTERSRCLHLSRSSVVECTDHVSRRHPVDTRWSIRSSKSGCSDGRRPVSEWQIYRRMHAAGPVWPRDGDQARWFVLVYSGERCNRDAVRRLQSTLTSTSGYCGMPTRRDIVAAISWRYSWWPGRPFVRRTTIWWGRLQIRSLVRKAKLEAYVGKGGEMTEVAEVTGEWVFDMAWPVHVG